MKIRIFARSVAERLAFSFDSLIFILFAPGNLVRLLRENVGLIRGQVPRECSVCGHKGLFHAFGIPLRFNAQCVNCKSLERHRLIVLALSRNEVLKGVDELLHFAPELPLKKFLEGKISNYQTADLSEGRAQHKLNIEYIDLESEAFDAINV